MALVALYFDGPNRRNSLMHGTLPPIFYFFATKGRYQLSDSYPSNPTE